MMCPCLQELEVIKKAMEREGDNVFRVRNAAKVSKLIVGNNSGCLSDSRITDEHVSLF